MGTVHLHSSSNGFEVCLAVLGTLAGTIGKQMVRYSKLVKENQKQQEGNCLLVTGSVIQLSAQASVSLNCGYGQFFKDILGTVVALPILTNTLLLAIMS